MRPATKKDMPTAIAIISKAYKTNPSILWVVKNDKKIDARIKELAKYSFKTALLRKGAYMSSNGKGITLCFKPNYKKESISDYWNQLLLAIKAIGIFRVKKVLKREAYVKSQRPKTGNYLNFWFYGVEPGFNGKGDAKEMKDEIFRMAKSQNLPIYLETSIEKNRRVYQRYGFETYHTWPIKEQGVNLYFMRREVEKS